MSDVKIKVSADGVGFQRGMEGVQRSIESTKHLIEAAFGAMAIEKLFSKSVENAEELVNTSRRLAIAPHMFQLMKQAAKESGVEIDNVTSAVERLNALRQKALNGNKGALTTFHNMGITNAQLHSQIPTDQLLNGPIADFVKRNNPQVIGGTLRDAFGKSAGQLVPYLHTDFGELDKKMTSRGMFTNTTDAVKIKAVAEEFQTLATILTNIFTPAVVKLAEFIVDFVAQGFGSKIVEEQDFKLKVKEGWAKQPNFTASNGEVWTAETRAAQSSAMRDLVRGALDTKTDFADFKNQQALPFNSVFQDFKGGSYPELNQYLNKLSEPAMDIIKGAGDSSSHDMSALRQAIADMKAKMEKDAYNLEHPGTTGGGFNFQPTKTGATKALLAADNSNNALVKIGGLLGVDQKLEMARLQQKTNDLLLSIDTTLKEMSGDSGSTLSDSGNNPDS